MPDDRISHFNMTWTKRRDLRGTADTWQRAGRQEPDNDPGKALGLLDFQCVQYRKLPLLDSERGFRFTKHDVVSLTILAFSHLVHPTE